MKRQTLITCGLIVMIILIIVGALTYYGLSSPSGMVLSQTKNHDQVNVLGLSIIDANSGNMELNLENSVGGSIEIIGATLHFGSGSPIAYTASKPMLPGTSSVTSFTPTSGWTAMASGGQYTAIVTINYLYHDSVFSSSDDIEGTYS
jgi:hypothetical protein